MAADYDLEDLELRTRDLVAEAVASFFTDITDDVNEGQRTIAALARCYQLIDNTRATAVSTRTVGLADSAYQAHAVEYRPASGASVFLRECLPKQLARRPNKSASTPQDYFTIPGGSIGIEPLPAAIHNLTIYTSNAPATIGTGELPVIPRQFWNLLPLFGLYRCLQKEGRGEVAAQIRIIIEAEIRFYAADYGSQFPDGKDEYNYE